MRTIADFLRPARSETHQLLREIFLVLGGSLFVALCAKIQLPIGPVPMTLQSFAVVVVGAVLGSRRGAAAMVAYLLEGAAGLPVFAGPAAGMMYLVGPTGGYLLGFVAAAYLVGLLAERGWDKRIPSALAAFAIGQAAILAMGFLWLSFFVGAKSAFATGVAPFLAYDVTLKTVLAAITLPTAWRFVGIGRDGNKSR